MRYRPAAPARSSALGDPHFRKSLPVPRPVTVRTRVVEMADLLAERNPSYTRSPRRGAAILYCVECGCCAGEIGHGWTAWICNDPDEVDPPTIAVYCPPCAAEEFGYRPEVAAHYVRSWEPGANQEWRQRQGL